MALPVLKSCLNWPLGYTKGSSCCALKPTFVLWTNSILQFWHLTTGIPPRHTTFTAGGDILEYYTADTTCKSVSLDSSPHLCSVKLTDFFFYFLKYFHNFWSCFQVLRIICTPWGFYEVVTLSHTNNITLTCKPGAGGFYVENCCLGKKNKYDDELIIACFELSMKGWMFPRVQK
jgi:hypothetical protein